MLIAVERQWHVHLDADRLLLDRRKGAAHEAVVPDALLRHEEVALDAVAQQQLALLAHRGREALRLIAARVLVLGAPLVALRVEGPGRQRHRPRRERHRHRHRLLVPARMGRHEARVLRHVHGRHVMRLVARDGVDDAQRLQLAEVLVLRQLMRQRRVTRVPDLRHHDDALDLLDLLVVRRRRPVEVAGHLHAQVGDRDEPPEDVLRDDVGVVLVLADVVRRDVDVVGSCAEVRRRDRSRPPLGLRREGLLLEVRRRRHDDVLAVDVLRLGRDGGQLLLLRLLLLLLVYLRRLLALHRRRADLHAQDDVSDLARREAGRVHVVLLAVVVQDEIAELRLDLDPVFVRQRRPDVVLLRDDGLVRAQHELRLVLVDVERSQDEHEPREGGVGRDGLQPLVVQVDEDHLWLRRPQDHVAQLLDLHRGLERQLQLRGADGDVREVQEVHLQRVEQTLARHDELLRLLLDRQGPDERRHLFGRLPLGELAETLLARPDAGVDDLEEQLARPRVEDEDGAVDGLRRQVALERLVDRHAVDVGVVDEVLDLVAEELRVVLGVEELLVALGRVQLKALSDPLPQDVEGRVRLHDLRHGLLDQGLEAREVLAVRRVEVVGQVDADHETGRRRIDAHAVGGVVEVLGSHVPLDVVRVVVAVAQLHVDPELVRRRGLDDVFGVEEQRRPRHVPLVAGEEEDVGAGAVHLVRLPRMDRFLLDRLDAERHELLVEHLTQVHDDGLVDLLPQVRAEDLDERDLECRDLAVEKDAGEIQLHLEADVDVRAVDGR